MTRPPTPPAENFQRATYLGEGDFSVGWLINDRWVCRFAKHPEAAASLRREACLLPQIADIMPLPIPQPVCYPVASSTIAIHPLIPGEPLTSEQFLKLDNIARERCTQQLANFLAALHRTDLALAQQCGIETVDYLARYQEVRRNAEQHLIPQLPAPDRAYVHKIFHEFLANPQDPATFALLHGDLSPDHVLWKPSLQKITGILDFGDMQIGDPAWDLVFLREDYGRAFLTHFNEALLHRASRFRALDTIEWAASVCSGARGPEGQDCLARIAALREKNGCC